MRLTPRDRLLPADLAAHHEARLVALSALPGVPAEHVQLLQADDSKELSAFTVLREGRVMIVVNDAHTPERQANSICHEIAHLLLEHRPSSAFDALGNRIFPVRDEAEADWLAGCLLVPAAGLRAVLQTKGGQAGAARHFGVSPELMRWRCNMNGLARVA